MQYGEMHCLGCNLKCEILPSKEFSSTQCLNRQICIWPAVNFFFEAGLKSLINTVDVIFPVSGFIFVDFSWRSIRFFMDERWIDYLGCADMKIILLSDKKMTPLAAYYSLNEPRVSGTIYISDDINKLKTSLRKVFVGQPLVRQAVRSLTRSEKEILYLTLSNYSVADISRELVVDTKSVYNIRQRLEGKLGVKIRRFL